MPESIHVKLPDGSVKEVPKGTTALDIAKSIGQRLADATLVAKTNGDLIDVTKPLEKDTDLRLLTDRDPEALEVYRHSSAHLLAAAVLELFPETKLGHGPPTDTGFFYDFYRPAPFTPEDLQKIEKKMQELVQQDIPYARESCHAWHLPTPGCTIRARSAWMDRSPWEPSGPARARSITMRRISVRASASLTIPTEKAKPPFAAVSAPCSAMSCPRTSGISVSSATKRPVSHYLHSAGYQCIWMHQVFSRTFQRESLQVRPAAGQDQFRSLCLRSL